MTQETFTRPQLLKAVREAQERFELAGQALIDGLTRENAELRALVRENWTGRCWRSVNDEMADRIRTVLFEPEHPVS